jgi:hypothetical protein
MLKSNVLAVGAAVALVGFAAPALAQTTPARNAH